MKKIPTLFTRIYEGRKIVGIKDEIAPVCKIKRTDFGYEWPVKDK